MLLTGFEIRSNMAVDVNFNIFSITAIIISLQGFFLGIVILKYKSAESRGNMLLALFVLAYTYSTTNIIRDFTNLVFIVPHLLWTEIPILFLLAPLFYFYCMKMTGKSYRKRWFYLLHFIPFVLSIAVLFPRFFQGAEAKLDYLFNLHRIIDCRINTVMLSFNAQMFIYLFFSSRLIRNYRDRIKNLYSSIEKINLSWLSFFKNILLVVYSLHLLVGIAIVNQINLPFNFFILMILSGVLIYGISFKIMFNPQVYTAIQAEGGAQQSRYSRSSLSPDIAGRMLDRLRAYMEDEKPYLEPELTLDNLAEELRVSRNHLSEAINRYTGMKFFDFVNSYRVEEARRLLMLDSCSVITAAMQSGFNTKQTFNTAFKKHTGMTPSAFRKSAMK